MTANTMKLGLAAFVVLGGAAIANIAVLQPNGGRSGATKTVQSRKLEAAGVVPRTDAGQAGTATREAAPPRGAIGKTASEPAPHATAVATSGPDITRAVQRELKERGYETGTVDGQPGLMTRAAIMAYEHDRDLPLTGEPSPQLLKQILLNAPPVMTPARPATGQEQSMQATQVIRTVQQSLVTLGYVPGKVDGRLGDDTVRAIREFELDQSMPETGRVSGQLVARLSRLAGQGRMAAQGRSAPAH